MGEHVALHIGALCVLAFIVGVAVIARQDRVSGEPQQAGKQRRDAAPASAQ